MSRNDEPGHQPGSSKKVNWGKQPQLKQAVNFHIETRKNVVSCFRTKTAGEPHFFGVIVLENIPPGKKIGVAVGVREIQSGPHAGKQYLSVSLRPFSQERSKA